MKHRIVINCNSDYPEEFGWEWTARLERHEDNDWYEVGAEDGDTPGEAVKTLREEYRLARDADIVGSPDLDEFVEALDRARGTTE